MTRWIYDVISDAVEIIEERLRMLSVCVLRLNARASLVMLSLYDILIRSTIDVILQQYIYGQNLTYLCNFTARKGFFLCIFMKLIILHRNSIPSSFTLVFKINSEKHHYNETLRNTPMLPLILFQKYYNTIQFIKVAKKYKKNRRTIVVLQYCKLIHLANQ